MEKNFWSFVIGALILGLAVGYYVKGNQTTVSPATQTNQTSQTNQATKPHQGYDLHIDAEMHFPGDAKKVAHHFCKPVSGGLTECQLYDSDNPDAKLVGVEMVVPTDTYNKFNAKEKAYWHYHKWEIPKVNAKMPDLSEEEAMKVMKGLEETYGKIYLLWDPSKGDMPVGDPSITILK
ncbi:DUF1264 domain-containing protein [Candidatus Gottesmanbacteria bacterium]|nr:DUF1264 domain-containing protein [Candidatus Gottesmanbacteria bacterium]